MSTGDTLTTSDDESTRRDRTRLNTAVTRSYPHAALVLLALLGCGEPASPAGALTTNTFALNDPTSATRAEDFVLVAVRDDGDLLAITSVHVGTSRQLSARKRQQLRAMATLSGPLGGGTEAYCIAVMDLSNVVQAQTCQRLSHHLHLPPRHGAEPGIDVYSTPIAFARRLPLSQRTGSPFRIEVQSPDGRRASTTGRR